MLNVNTLGAMKTLIDSASNEIELLKDSPKHWNCIGKRSVATAVALLKEDSIVAIPTDTIYGLVGVASRNESIQKLYDIKKRDKNKPLSISVSSVKDINTWGVTDHLPDRLLPTMLPGPYTVILKRTPALNPAFNPDFDTVGIRVPRFTFINCIAKLIGPLALTSANESNKPSCLYASEFENLWPFLGGIFYNGTLQGKTAEHLRKGSTIVDLTKPGYFKIVRPGVGLRSLYFILKHYNLKKDES